MHHEKRVLASFEQQCALSVVVSPQILETRSCRLVYKAAEYKLRRISQGEATESSSESLTAPRGHFAVVLPGSSRSAEAVFSKVNCCGC